MVVHKHNAVIEHIPGRWMPGLLLVFLFISFADLSGQGSPFDTVWTPEASEIWEKVDFFTDRSVYIAGEEMQFRARVSVQGLTGSGPWSTVLYVEVVSADGTRICGGKYPVQKEVSTGEIRIPADMLTGHYYLRAYTRWMRNRGPGTYTYLPLRIINPHRSELYPVTSAETAGTQPLFRDSAETSLEFIKPDVSFARGDSIAMDLRISGPQLPDSLVGCITVVPMGLRPSRLQYLQTYEKENFQLEFLPDRHGPSLSGTVLFPGGHDQEISPALIHFSLMGDKSGYFMSRSDKMGRFSVGLPMRRGKLEIFVQPESPDNTPLGVRIDQDFDPRQIHFPHTPFTLSDPELTWAAIMARNVQLAGIYYSTDTLITQHPEMAIATFYGTPSFSVDLDQYVLLPTLREVFLNLVPSVTPVSQGGRTSLLIESVNPSLSLYESLVMVDQVPVLDMEQFMFLSPARIKQIDVIEDVYVKGDLRFGGVINLHSRERDMAGIDLPENSFFIDYMALQPATKLPRQKVSADDKIPDTRNTFLWLPEYMLRKDSPNRLSFVAPAYPGEYTVLFRGVGAQGAAIAAETSFTVR